MQVHETQDSIPNVLRNFKTFITINLIEISNEQIR